MKQSFLNSLVGMDEDVAISLCDEHGLKHWSLAKGQAHILVAMPNTVLLYVDSEGFVSSARAGDPLQVEDDTQ